MTRQNKNIARRIIRTRLGRTEMETTTSLQETSNFIPQGACAAVGWKMRRHSTSQPKQEEHSTSVGTTPVKPLSVSTWSVVACAKLSTQVRHSGPSETDSMVTRMR